MLNAVDVRGGLARAGLACPGFCAIGSLYVAERGDATMCASFGEMVNLQ